MGYKSRGSSAKRAQILEALIREGPMTADASISSRHLYHNTWAPIFTALRRGADRTYRGPRDHLPWCRGLNLGDHRRGQA